MAGKSIVLILVLALLAAPATADATFPGRNGDIAVGTSFGSGLDIGRIDLAGNRTRVTSTTTDESSPAWSPDGSRIAFARYEGDSDLFIANADGSNEVRLMNSLGMEESPAWSPDGREIVYVGSSECQRDTSCFGFLVIIDVATRIGRPVPGAVGYRPTWSPDGELIAFVGRACSTCPSNIYTVRPDGSDLTQLAAPGGGVDPTWSPDGSKIAFSSFGDGCCVTRNIWIMNRDGSERRRVTSTAPQTTFGSADHPAWSPDGTLIAFLALPSPGGCGSSFCEHELYTIAPDGTGLHRLTTNTLPEFEPDWGVAQNGPPDCSAVTASRPVLTTHNRRLVAVSLDGATDPDGDPVTVSVDGVTQDEPVTGPGDPTSPDAIDEGEGELRVRAERSPRGDGRVYRIAFTVTDGRGGSCSGTATVSVPRKKRKPAVDSAPPSYDSFGRQ